MRKINCKAVEHCRVFFYKRLTVDIPIPYTLTYIQRIFEIRIFILIFYFYAVHSLGFLAIIYSKFEVDWSYGSQDIQGSRDKHTQIPCIYTVEYMDYGGSSHSCLLSSCSVLVLCLFRLHVSPINNFV